MRLRAKRLHAIRAGVRAILAGALITLVPGLVLAQTVSPMAGGDGMPAPSGVIRVNLAGQNAGSQNLSIPRGKSAIIELPVDARDVMVTRPDVADAVLRSPRRIYIVGVAPGQTDAAFFDASGRRILALNIRVDQDFGALAQTIGRILPGSHVHVDAVNNSVILSGQVQNATDADHAVQIAQQFTAKPEQVVNMIGIAGKEQVMLKVRIVEVQRNVIKQLGFNLNAIVGQLGSSQFLLSTAASFGVNGALLGGLAGAGYALDTTQQPELQVPCAPGLTGTCWQVIHGPGQFFNPTTQKWEKIANWDTATTQTTAGSRGLNKAGSTIDAFERVGLVRTLAEPNLTAISGESAKFLAGGEFPVPVGSDVSGRTSIDFKPFGVGLGFTPIVLSSGRISLKISTEVSELSSLGAFNLTSQSSSSSSGGTTTSVAGPTITVPGLNVRRAETTVELPSGGAMMIAGLLKEETKQDLDSLPGLMNLPVLGALFRSRDYQAGETELVIIVTPYLVNPTSPANLQTPADGLQIANDAETILLGRLNKVYKAPPAAVAGRTYQGPVGYVIE
jgi:pilus assembly protein CpaC